MADASSRSRVQAGVPTGGQFSTEAKGENPDLSAIPEYGTPEYWAHCLAYSEKVLAQAPGEIAETGGGCTAIQVGLGPGGSNDYEGQPHLLVTDGNAGLPDGNGLSIGAYDDEGCFDEIEWEHEGPMTPEQTAAKIRSAVRDWRIAKGLDPKLPQIGQHVWMAGGWALVVDVDDPTPDGRTVLRTSRGLVVAQPGEKVPVLESEE